MSTEKLGYALFTSYIYVCVCVHVCSTVMLLVGIMVQQFSVSVLVAPPNTCAHTVPGALHIQCINTGSLVHHTCTCRS